MKRFAGLKDLFNETFAGSKVAKLQDDDKLVTLQVGKTVWEQAPRQMRVELWMSALQRRGVGVAAAAKYEDMLLTPVSDEAVSDIEKDIARTFPNTKRFAAPEGQEALRRVLHAYAAYDPEVGYCQGMNFVAGLLLMYLQERHAFGGLVVLMQDRGLRKYYSTDMSLLQTHLWQLGRLIPQRLCAHLESHGVLPLLYGASWLMTCFSADFPASFSARVMDVILHGWMMDQALLKAAVGVLARCENRLLQLTEMEDCLMLIKYQAPAWEEAMLHDVLTEAFNKPWTAQQLMLLNSTEGAESVAEALQRVQQANLAAAAARGEQTPPRSPVGSAAVVNSSSSRRERRMSDSSIVSLTAGATEPGVLGWFRSSSPGPNSPVMLQAAPAAGGSSSSSSRRISRDFNDDSSIPVIPAPAGVRVSVSSSGAAVAGAGSSSSTAAAAGLPPPPSPKRPLATSRAAAAAAASAAAPAAAAGDSHPSWERGSAHSLADGWKMDAQAAAAAATAAAGIAVPASAGGSRPGLSVLVSNPAGDPGASFAVPPIVSAAAYTGDSSQGACLIDLSSPRSDSSNSSSTPKAAAAAAAARSAPAHQGAAGWDPFDAAQQSSGSGTSPFAAAAGNTSASAAAAGSVSPFPAAAGSTSPFAPAAAAMGSSPAAGGGLNRIGSSSLRSRMNGMLQQPSQQLQQTAAQQKVTVQELRQQLEELSFSQLSAAHGAPRFEQQGARLELLEQLNRQQQVLQRHYSMQRAASVSNPRSPRATRSQQAVQQQQQQQQRGLRQDPGQQLGEPLQPATLSRLRSDEWTDYQASPRVRQQQGPHQRP